MNQKIEDIISQCDAYKYLKNGGGDLNGNNYSEKNHSYLS